MRCFLLFNLIEIRFYLNKMTKVINTPEFNSNEVAQFIMNKLAKLKFASQKMLQPKDIHIDQISESLKGALIYGAAVLEKAEIHKDFAIIQEQIKARNDA